MNQDEGLRILASRGWLSATPPEFQRALLSRSVWHCLEAGAPLQFGGEKTGEMIGLARGVLEMRTILGPAETPIMHLAHPVFWLGYVPIILGKSRRLSASAKTRSWLARIPENAVKEILSQHPHWWQYLLQPAIIYGDVSQTVAADLLIRDSERRCAAVLLRLSGRRFPGPDDGAPADVPVSQSELAGAANLSRNSVGAIVKRLAARGLIKQSHRSIVVLSPNALRAFVQTGA
jgi:CRP-like cAMP-binding protein